MIKNYPNHNQSTQGYFEFIVFIFMILPWEIT